MADKMLNMVKMVLFRVLSENKLEGKLPGSWAQQGVELGGGLLNLTELSAQYFRDAPPSLARIAKISAPPPNM